MGTRNGYFISIWWVKPFRTDFSVCSFGVLYCHLSRVRRGVGQKNSLTSPYWIFELFHISMSGSFIADYTVCIFLIDEYNTAVYYKVCWYKSKCKHNEYMLLYIYPTQWAYPPSPSLSWTMEDQITPMTLMVGIIFIYIEIRTGIFLWP